MEKIEELIPDNEGNHLVVVLNFYDKSDRINQLHIPAEFFELDIADICIETLDRSRPLGVRALLKMCDWLLEQMLMFPNAVFSFVCSTQSLDTNHSGLPPEKYRWRLFESLYIRKSGVLAEYGIRSENIVVGPEGYESFAKVFYRDKHAPIIYVVAEHLRCKFND